LTLVTSTMTSLHIEAVGILEKNGGGDTAGSLIFDGHNLKGTLSFTNTTAATPDGGSAVALLGIALAGMEGVRRVIRARKA
jgi:hypothetical protein